MADSAGREATDLAASAGLILDPWQAQVLDVGLGERTDGKWAAREVGLVVPRQNGKGAILEALILASLLLFDEKLILYSAHEFKTAQETFLRVKALIESTDDLRSRVSKIHNAHGAEGIELTTGHRLRFVARTKGSGRGFSPQRVILDEALNLSSRSVSALLFAMSAQDNPQIWYTSSHPEPTIEGEVLRKLMRRGRAGGDPSLAYIEHCAADDADPYSEEAAAAANPGYPHRISEDTVRSEQNSVDLGDYKRERLGIVDLTETSAERIIPEGLWAAANDAEVVPDGVVHYAIDASPDLRSAAIGVSDGRAVRVMEHHDGVYWLPKTLKEILDDRPGDVWLDPRGPVNALLVDLDDVGVSYKEVTAAQHAQACGGLLAAVLNGDGVRHAGQPILDAAVAGATRRPYGDAWAWNRRTASADICPLVAVTIARWAALNDGGDFLW